MIRRIELPAGTKVMVVTLDKKPEAWAFEKSPATIELRSYGAVQINSEIWTLTNVRSELV